ncbi:MAG: hypothetical protein ACXAC5_12975 [Promethearchaeota archaeon]|jgi:hypothetical protein
MAKKSSSHKDIQGLLVFKPKEGFRKKKIDKYLVEKNNEEDKITIINSFTTQGINYRYSISLNNESSTSIVDLDIKVFYPEFLNYARSYPMNLRVSSLIEENEDNKKSVNINLEELKGKTSDQFYLHFTPSTQLSSGEFRTILKYKNNKGKEGKINTNSINIQIDKMIITPKIISHSGIREFSRIPGTKRALISLGIGTSKKLKFKKIFDVFENLIQSYNFQFITKDKEKGMLWFFGYESESNNDLLALSKIGFNNIEIIAYSKNPVLLGLFLFSIYKNLKEQFVMNKVIKPKVKLFELECLNCGYNLPYFPKKGESITCFTCSYKQIVW